MELNEDQNIHIDINQGILFWKSKYTTGNITGRGTRIWFNTNFCITINIDNYNQDTFCDDEDNDSFCLRHHNLQGIIKDFKSISQNFEECEYDTVIIKVENIEELYTYNSPNYCDIDDYDIIEILKKEKCIYRSSGLLFCFNVNISEIISELEYINTLAIENDIEFKWI